MESCSWRQCAEWRAQVLGDPYVGKGVRRARAEGLRELGAIFQAAATAVLNAQADQGKVGSSSALRADSDALDEMGVSIYRCWLAYTLHPVSPGQIDRFLDENAAPLLQAY